MLNFGLEKEGNLSSTTNLPILNRSVS